MTLLCTIPALVAAIQFLAPDLGVPVEHLKLRVGIEYPCSGMTLPGPTELARLECELAREHRRLAEEKARRARMQEIAALLEACRQK